MQFKILAGALLTFFVIIILRFIMRIIRPSYSQVEKKIKINWMILFKAKWSTRWFKVQNFYYNLMVKTVRLSPGKEREYKRYINRLNLKWNYETLDPRMIRVDQYSYFILCILIGLLCLTFFKELGIIALIASPLGLQIPLVEMKEKVEKLDAAISKEFYSFYSVIYYQFRKQNKMLSSVVREYLPNATPEMAFELRIFLHNLEKGEEYALVELRKRLPLKHIIRFCDIMKVRVVGIENISQMMYLKEEMHEEERHRIKKALERRKKQATVLQTAVYLLLIQFIIVYWYLQLNGISDVLNFR